MRSRKAAAAVRKHDADGPILQIGGTFAAVAEPSERFYCFCDGNAMFGRKLPFKRASSLTEQEAARLVAQERSVYEKARIVFAMSECLRRSFINDFKLAPEKIVTVYAGANMETIPSEADLQGEKFAEPTILFIGKEFERKGGHVLVEAFEKVRKAIGNARLILVGSNPAVREIPGMEIRGYVSRAHTGPGSLTSLYRSSHLFCMPSQFEPFGVVFVEAMLHGLPCVGTTEWAMPEIIEDGKTGWVAPPGDADALAGRLIEALKDRQRLAEMGMAGRERALANFTWERVAEKICRTMYGEVVQDPTPAGRVAMSH
jgi:glycosyltransferase involved in cell wall biosynthesis